MRERERNREREREIQIESRSEGIERDRISVSHHGMFPAGIGSFL